MTSDSGGPRNTDGVQEMFQEIFLEFGPCIMKLEPRYMESCMQDLGFDQKQVGTVVWMMSSFGNYTFQELADKWPDNYGVFKSYIMKRMSVEEPFFNGLIGCMVSAYNLVCRTLS